MKKDFFPIPCPDGMVRPVILILIEEICLILGSKEERKQYRDFFETPLCPEHTAKLSQQHRDYENHILEIGKHLHYVYQEEKRGFGDAVYHAMDFAHGDPVLLMLGDTIYRSTSNKPCALQLIEAYERHNQLMVSIHPIPLAEVSRYGILSGIWEDNKERKILNVSTMHEKPKASYAEEFLGVQNADGQNEYFSVFGQYILTQDVFDQLAMDILDAAENDDQREIELTSALERVRKEKGMIGIRLDGKMYDMGNPAALSNAMIHYPSPNPQ